jgi:soluble lytic murein transglycosylase-like protein
VVFLSSFRLLSLPFRGCVLASLWLLGIAAPARAQIFSWRDANGTLVLSNVRPGAASPHVSTYDVPEAEGIRTTRSAKPSESGRFDDIIGEHASRSGIREGLVRAVIQVESGFNPHAVSNKGAMGLMQLMPATARQFGVVNPFDPAQNIRGGVSYLRQLLDRYKNDETLALAAYNAGPGAVDRSGQAVPPYRETRDYVSRVSGIAGERAAPPRVTGTRIYRTVEVIDGREIVKYTDQNPTTR